MPPRKRVKELETDDVDTSGPTTASARKNQSKAVGKRRSGNSGKLALLLEMPTEIFTEIACYMSPEDLLSLSRTSAGFRELLMSKSSMRIWEAARTVQGIPACPSDLSEPQYADLLFGKGCSFCSETRTRKTHIPLRVRACKLCTEERILDLGALLRKTRYRVPAVRINKHRHFTVRKFIASQLREVLEKVEALSSTPEDLQTYVSDRLNTTQTVMKVRFSHKTLLLDYFTCRNGSLRILSNNGNNHELCFSEATGRFVARFPRTTVDMAPTGENAGRYSALPTSWGKYTNYERILEPFSGLSESEDKDGDGEKTPEIFERLKCPLCEKLDIFLVELSEHRMRRHMRDRHGTDLEGNLLTDDSLN